jgi:hypothetical protein
VGYRVKKSSKCQDQFRALAEEFDRMQELNNAIEWYLSRMPRAYAFCIEGDTFLWVTDDLANGFPLLRILYSVNDDDRTVVILSIQKTPKVNLSLQ